ncbi:MAG: amidohydrolase family protein [Planctomycetota bacterium]
MIDAHQHFWQIGRCRYDWLTPELGPLHADHLPRDLEPILARHGVERTVLVQASDTVEETRWLLELARDNAFVLGVVGWVPLDAPDAPRVLRELARAPRLVGVRPMLQDLERDDWILDDAVAPGLDAVEELGLVFDALVRPRQLGAIVELARRRPGLRIVLDHLGKPDIAAGPGWSGLARWRDELARLAESPSVACKLSGLASEAGPNCDAQDLEPYVTRAMETFGAERLLWGSDWPVCDAACGYDRWLELTQNLLGKMTSDRAALVLGRNAARVYARRPPPGSDHPS